MLFRSAVFDMEQLQDKMGEYAYTLQHLCRNRIRQYRNRMTNYQTQLKYLSPASQIREKRTFILHLEDTLSESMKRRIQEKKHDLALYIEKMKGLSPLEKLSQGYAYASDGNGRTVCRVSQVKPDDELSVYVKDGVIHAKVTDCRELVIGE